VTLSLLKNAEDRPGVKQKLCYDESVYRPGSSHDGYREITQTGLECIGDLDGYDLYEVVSLAVRSLETVSERFVLEINHLGLLTALLDELDAGEEPRKELARCVAGKNAHDLRRLAREYALNDTAAERLCTCMEVYGPADESVEKLRALCGGETAGSALDELERLVRLLTQNGLNGNLIFDFSLVSDMKYYNGVVLRGYLPGVAERVLAGGQYDNLMRRMGRRSRAIGFAVYLDQLEQTECSGKSDDVDVLLLYDEITPPETVADTVAAITAEGKSVSAQRAVPKGLRCGEIRDLREGAAT
jgi:ATP phosphoribosyltransferase regulatory subunit